MYLDESTTNHRSFLFDEQPISDMQDRLLRLQVLLNEQSERLNHAKANLTSTLEALPTSPASKTEDAAVRIQRYWKDILSTRSTSPDLPSDMFLGESAMNEIEGYFLFSFELVSISSELEVGYSKSRKVSKLDDDWCDLVSVKGKARVSGEITDIPGSLSVQPNDIITLAVTKGTGQIQLLLNRTGDCLQAPFPKNLPVLGPVYPVIRGGEIIPLHKPSAAPMVGVVNRDEDALMTDGPIPQDGLDLEISEDPVAPVLLGFTNCVGAALWVSRLDVRPLWLVDFEAGEISYIPTRDKVVVTTWKPPASLGPLQAGDVISLKPDGNVIKIKINQVLIAQVDLKQKELEISSLFFLCEGLPSLQP